jgi:phytoene dehydrogenase-like protein
MYDVAIIGGGIGGLVCGCYLAKSGLSVAILEKNLKVGGFCTSIIKGGFAFDSCVHSIGGLREGGALANVLNDLGLDKEEIFYKDRLVKAIVSDDKTFLFRNKGGDDFLNVLGAIYPKDRKALEVFLNIITKYSYVELALKTRGKSFLDFFIIYIQNKELIELFSFILLQCGGLPIDQISALVGSMLLREYFLDGCYYPKGGMQAIANEFLSLYLNLKGEVFLNSEVKKVEFVRDSFYKLETEKKEFLSKFIISNIDLRYTLKNILKIPTYSLIWKKVLKFKPSLSNFILYLKIKLKQDLPSYLQYISIKDRKRINYYAALNECEYDNIFIDSFFRKKNDFYLVSINLPAPYKSKSFWDVEGVKMSKHLAYELSRRAGIAKEDINIAGWVTPIDLNKWTYSFKGASFGWAPFKCQEFPKPEFSLNIPNFYFVGQWMGMGHGVSNVAYLGKKVSQKLLRSKFK